MPDLRRSYNHELNNMLNLNAFKRIEKISSPEKSFKFGGRRSSMLTLGVKNQSSNQTGKIDSIDPNSLSTFNKTNKFSTEAQDGLTMSRIKIKHNEIVRHNYMRNQKKKKEIITMFNSHYVDFISRIDSICNKAEQFFEEKAPKFSSINITLKPKENAMK